VPRRAHLHRSASPASTSDPTSTRRRSCQGFIPPTLPHPARRDERARCCARGKFAPRRTQILERTANHPFLVQLIASRLFESRDLAATLDQVAADEMVANFFSRRLPDPRRRRAGGARAEWPREAARSRRDLAQAMRRSEDAAEPLLFGLRMMGTWRRRTVLPHRQLVLRALAAPGAPPAAGEARRDVIVGVNRVYEHDGRAFHIQARTSASRKPASR
jgi:hypothetical protein